jgi:hypothetical protein
VVYLTAARPTDAGRFLVRGPAHARWPEAESGWG